MTSTRASAQDGTAELAEQIPESLRHLRDALRSETPWHQALLEAVGLWTLPKEVYRDRVYQYLIGGEAFDWLLLVERLCPELDAVMTQEEKDRLLFKGQLPGQVTLEVFRDLLGTNKYRGYLNYWYGVVVEEALQLSVEEEVRKRQIARCYPDSEDLVEDAYKHLYGESRTELLVEFRSQSTIPQRRDLSLADLKEFTYWLHKRRLDMWDPARVASDTRKGAQKLRQLERASGTNRDWSSDQPG